MHEATIQRVVDRVVRNLDHDGATVEGLVAGDADGWTDLRNLLMKSAGPRVAPRADYFCDEALQKIAVVLLSGTQPSRAAEELLNGPSGPRNEYIFTSPFAFWARTVVINLIIDEARRERRLRERPLEQTQTGDASIDTGELERARDSLTDLLQAIRALPPMQRSVMITSLCREQVKDDVVEFLHELAPDLVVANPQRPGSDDEIARSLETSPRSVAANRSVARAKLIALDTEWAALLDRLLPHRSTRPDRGARTESGEPG